MNGSDLLKDHGGEEISCEAVRISNDSMAKVQSDHPSRIRWYTSLPWQYPERAIEELSRTCEQGASGVMVLANVAGVSLADPRFAEIWHEIDRHSLQYLISIVGSDPVMFGTDWPHQVFDTKGAIEKTELLSEDQREAVRSKTATTLFGI